MQYTKFQDTKLPCPHGEHKLVEELFQMKNGSISKIRNKCQYDPLFEEIIDVFTEKDVEDILLEIIQKNEDMCHDANQDIAQKIFTKLKKNKSLNFENNDILGS